MMSELEQLKAELADLSEKHAAKLKELTDQITGINAEIAKEKSLYSTRYHNLRNRTKKLQSQ